MAMLRQQLRNFRVADHAVGNSTDPTQSAGTKTFVVADQLYLIALGIGDIERPPMYPRVFSGFDLKPQSLQSFLFSLEIGKRYFESDVVDGGSCGVRP